MDVLDGHRWGASLLGVTSAEWTPPDEEDGLMDAADEFEEAAQREWWARYGG